MQYAPPPRISVRIPSHRKVADFPFPLSPLASSGKKYPTSTFPMEGRPVAHTRRSQKMMNEKTALRTTSTGIDHATRVSSVVAALSWGRPKPMPNRITMHANQYSRLPSIKFHCHHGSLHTAEDFTVRVNGGTPMGCYPH